MTYVVFVSDIGRVTLKVHRGRNGLLNWRNRFGRRYGNHRWYFTTTKERFAQLRKLELQNALTQIKLFEIHPEKVYRTDRPAWLEIHA